MQLNQEQKAQLLERFTAYLDETDVVVETAENTVDLFTLFTELAALKAEVKIESRQVKGAIEEFKGLMDLLRGDNDRLKAELNRRHREEEERRLEIERPLLLEMLELRDRIEAGVSATEHHRPGLLARRTGRHLETLRQGMEISQRRLDGLLARYRVEAVETVGRPMDPYCMEVTGTESRQEQEEGTVLVEQRRGYLREGRLFRAAEVIVNKRAKS